MYLYCGYQIQHLQLNYTQVKITQNLRMLHPNRRLTYQTFYTIFLTYTFSFKIKLIYEQFQHDKLFSRPIA